MSVRCGTENPKCNHICSPKVSFPKYNKVRFAEAAQMYERCREPRQWEFVSWNSLVFEYVPNQFVLIQDRQHVFRNRDRLLHTFIFGTEVNLLGRIGMFGLRGCRPAIR